MDTIQTTDTVVYGGTDKPYDEWYPAYIIIGLWEGGTFRTHWIKPDIYKRAKEEAHALIRTYLKEKGRGTLVINTARWKKEICEAMVLIIQSHTHNVIKAIVEYPDFAVNHCRVFTLRRS